MVGSSPSDAFQAPRPFPPRGSSISNVDSKNVLFIGIKPKEDKESMEVVLVVVAGLVGLEVTSFASTHIQLAKAPS